VVVPSYLIIAGSIGLIFLNYFLQGAFAYGYSPFGFFPGNLLVLVGVAGLVLGPYFALAGFIAKENSVWFEANRMIHQHISIPIIGGFVLFIGSFSFYETLTAYLVVVFLGTLVSVMADRTKTTKPAPQPPEPAKS
jgi:hypothetical protein